jgi:hypothetical protein
MYDGILFFFVYIEIKRFKCEYHVFTDADILTNRYGILESDSLEEKP